MAKTDPIRSTDDEACKLARDLMGGARLAALGVLTPEGAPMVTRIAFGLDAEGAPLTLISALSSHTTGLSACPDCSLLIGEAGPRGDPLNQPRLTIQARATLIPNGTELYADLADLWLQTHPKAKLYIGFADFSFARFQVREGHLNGGFGKAYRLTPADLGLGT